MKTIAVLGYADCQILDVTGPLQVFASANRALGQDFYQIKILGLSQEPIVTNSGMRLVPDQCYFDATDIDTLLFAGGRGVDLQRRNQELINWIQEQAKIVRRIGSVCSGAFLLAEAGLLADKEAVSHWQCCDLLAEEFPDTRVNSDAIWIKQGDLYTSAGVTSGIDLALALVEEDLGHEIAMAVARELVVFMKRPGGQTQFSTQLEAQLKATGPVAKAVAYIEQHLNAELNLAILAEHCCVSERHLFRLFKSEFAQSPATYIENSRLSLARQLLESGALNLQRLAEQSGLASADNLRRVFIRRLGINPSEYRDRFGSVTCDQASKDINL
ncbi:GlxA family transcriptional regulator [Neptuniibacter sp. QD29_5]|uniref:GlxA family transcriptional regulator n=1 Tax=Neptuniibacter sp. QD29_5 TaxID=3398207 RepID=UPI0039F638B8